MRIHVHLARGFSLDSWEKGFSEGRYPDASPYGYHHLCTSHKLSWSIDCPETTVGRLCRLILKKLLGFDIVHAFRNRRLWASADVILTHTEYESLAVSALQGLTNSLRRNSNRRAKLIAQSVWLVDRWSTYGPLRRLAYRVLLRRSDFNITLSPVNAAFLSRLLGGKTAQFVPFGISLNSFPLQAPRFSPGPVIRLLALGNDVHRDWATLIEAVKDQREFDLKIVSRTITSASLRNATNISVEEAHNVERIRQLYGEVDVVVVPLLSNQHASGITVVLEAVALGKAVVCARVGGIDAYFAENEIKYYECGNARSLRNALRDLREKRDARDQAEKAQRRFRMENYSSEGYARRTLMCLEENT